jgi:APA family basic amino acid/polyamine antiporter
MTAASVFVMRRRRPALQLPYRVFGYPIIPVLFVVAAGCILISTLMDSPRESLLGLVLIFVSWPFYRYWRNKKQETANDVQRG